MSRFLTKSSLCTLAALTALFVGPSSANADTPQYTITYLDSLGTAIDSSMALGINASGQIVGTSFVSNTNHTYAFLYNPADNTMTDLGTLNGQDASATAINDLGQAVGYTSSGSFRQQAVSFQNHLETNLGTLGGKRTSAEAINNLGQIGGSSLTFAGVRTAFLASNGTIAPLASLPSSLVSTITGISDTGQSTGYYNTAQGQFHAFLATNSIFTDLGTLGGTTSQSTAINHNGQVTGFSTNASGNFHAFLYTNSVLHDLGTLGGKSSRAYGMNNLGQIVGQADAADNSTSAFLYRNGVMVNLKDLVTLDRLWSIDSGQAINDAGQIAGLGFHNRAGQAFLLTPNVAATGKPLAPLHVIGMVSSGFQTDLRWSPVSGAATYDVYRSSAATGPYTLCGSVSYATNYTDTNLTPSTKYFYQIIANNSFGSSPASTPISITTTSGAPQTRTVIDSYYSATSTLQISWYQVLGATSYRVYRSTSPGGSRIFVGESSSPGLLDTNLTPNSAYYYTVIPTNSYGQGPESLETKALTTTAPPAIAANAVAKAVSGTEIDLSWDAVPLADEYFIERNGLIIDTTTSPQFSDTGLSPGVGYAYEIRSSNKNGTGPIAATVSATTLIPLPGTITNFTATPVTPYQINLTWNASTDAKGYAIYRSQTAGGPHTFFASTTSPSFSDTGLTGDTTYYYVIIPNNAAGFGPKTAEVHATTFKPLIAPVIKTVTAISSSRIDLTWAACPGATTYQVYRSTTSGGYHTYIGQTTTATSFSNTGLTPKTSYYYIVVAMNSSVTSAKSTEVNATTLSGVPNAPGNLKATSVSKTQINLSWSAADGATNYTVYRSTASGTGRTIVGQTTTATSFSDKNLKPATQYYYVVVAGNAYGYTKSQEVSAVTLGLPGTPGNITATPISKSQINLAWTAASDATSYTIYRSTSSGTGRTIIGQTSGLSFNDTHAQPSTKYYYVVVAGNAFGYTKSAEVSATTQAQ